MSRLAQICLALVASFALGYWQGGRAADNAHAADSLKAREVAIAEARADAKTEAVRLEEARARILFDQQLEDLAYAEPVDDSCGLSPERVRRLRER